MNKVNKTAIVAMSGGVDSSVTAFLLQKKGYDVIGVFMRLGVRNEKAERAARSVCQKLGIKFYPINATAQFRREVIDYFVESYKEGITPNPCVKCNRVIKFGVLLKLMEQLRGDYLATGHYVGKLRMTTPYAKATDVKNDECRIRYKLLRGKDKNKDQSYFLYTLTQEKLGKILFPLGKMEKPAVRKIADKAGLPYLVSESQDACFLVKDGKIIDHNEFLKEKIKMQSGPIKLHNPSALRASPLGKGRDTEEISQDEIIGEHQGLPLYTIGQRRGVEIGGTGPYYVVKTDYDTNTLYVSKDHDDPALYTDEFIVKNTNWISGEEPKMPFEREVVIRYRHKSVKCHLTPSPSPSYERGVYVVKLKKPERAVTSGQSAVFYDGKEVIGGGIII